MKKRISVEKAEWSIEREQYYKQQCLSKAYDLKVEISERNSVTYLKKNGREKILCKPRSPRKIWYETWLTLKEIQK